MVMSTLLRTEVEYLNVVLQRYKFPTWDEIKKQHPKKLSIKNINKTEAKRNKTHIVVPYMQGLCGSFKNISNKDGM